MLAIPDRHDETIPSVKQWLRKKFDELYVVHRLDKDTSGVMLWATDANAHKYLSQLFEGRAVEKIYNALVMGQPPYESGMIEIPIATHPANDGRMITSPNGKEAVTGFKLLEHFGKYAWMAFKLYTGRTHQIRVHARHAGMPLVADPVYGDGKPFLLSSVKHKYALGKHQEEEKPLINRTALHAATIAFTTQEGVDVEIEAPLPRDLKASLQQLRKWS